MNQQQILKQSSATESMLNERGQRYGEFCDHASITQGIKAAMQSGKNWTIIADDQVEALEMVAHKIGRILNGDPNYLDSWDDIVGYVTLITQRLRKEETHDKSEKTTLPSGNEFVDPNRPSCGTGRATDFIPSGRYTRVDESEFDSSPWLHNRESNTKLPRSPLVQLASLDSETLVVGYVFKSKIVVPMEKLTLAALHSLLKKIAPEVIDFEKYGIWSDVEGFQDARYR